MDRIDKRFRVQTNPLAQEGAVIRGDNYRITMLTAQLVRLEYNEEGVFEDRPTQTVWRRNFTVPEFHIIEAADKLEVITDHIHIIYNKKEFSRHGLNISVRGNISQYCNVWYYGDEPDDLRGTARTLDGADGAVELEPGLMSKFGFSVLDDSDSLVLAPDGWVEVRNKSGKDLYFFGYGRDYKACLKDFYRISGRVPLLPRYALGNWWSRFHKYTDETFKALFERFEAEQVPFSVAVVDMDWHLTDIDPKYGSGWTGYTWNRELFPDPRAFMEWLHSRNYRITLNVHPAAGVQAHEEQYVEMAQALGVDYENEVPIVFDISDPEFLEAYFHYLHHKNEDDGVDFWWVDWQQGDVSGVAGLDPLWMLNHYHYLDIQRKGQRPLTFSRYAGLGSHRYPLGFSGDTIATWESLAFQPYFTANAANAGYVWWSHDIGGHMMGIKEDELAVRWVQSGVFSPVSRLHSSGSMFNGKEPWNYGREAERIIKCYLQLRHRMVPYLYTMNYLTCFESLPLVMPVYYNYPFEEAAYAVKNEYFFGTEMLVCPVTGKLLAGISHACEKVWLPAGFWFDFFTGKRYKGDCFINVYRTLEAMPVFARAGAIVPLADINACGNATDNPEVLEIIIFPDHDGTFVLYEDDGSGLEPQADEFARTKIALDWENLNISIKVEGNTEVLPDERTYRFILRGWKEQRVTGVYIAGEEVISETVNGDVVFAVGHDCIRGELEIELTAAGEATDNTYAEELFDFLCKAQIEVVTKERIYDTVVKNGRSMRVLHDLQAMEAEPHLKEAVSEILWADV